MKASRFSRKRIQAVWLCCLLVMAASSGYGQDKATDLAKKSQNPVSDLISVPFKNNFNLGTGPEDNMQYVLCVQPVYPQHMSEQWNWIHRAIIPLINQPSPINTFGLSDIQYQGFLSPAQPGKWIWGVGPVLQIPSATNETLGTGKWSAGAGVVALTVLEKNIRRYSDKGGM